MNGSYLSRRELKFQAKRTLGRWVRPCCAASIVLLIFTMILQVVQMMAPGAGLYYLVYASIEEYPVQSGIWRLESGATTHLLNMIGLSGAANFGGAGGLLASLRIEAAGIVYLFLVPFAQLPVALLIALVMLLLSTPILYGAMGQFWRVLRGEPGPFRGLFSWYLDLRLTGKAVALQLLLSLWRMATGLVCMAPGMLITILGASETEASPLMTLAPVLTLVGLAAGYFLYTLLLPAQYLMARSPELSVGGALSGGFRLLKGRRRAFFFFQLSFVLWHVVSLMLYQALDLYVVPYQSMATMLFLTAAETAHPEHDGPNLTLLDGGQTF